MSKYEGLTSQLARERLREIILSFREIEVAIGDQLPKSARLPQFWENPKDPKHIQGVKKAVRGAGFKSFMLAGQDKVRFVRD